MRRSRRRRGRQFILEIGRRLVRAAVRLAYAVDDAIERGLAGREWLDADADLRAQTRGVYVLVAMVAIVTVIEYAAHHQIVNLFNR